MLVSNKQPEMYAKRRFSLVNNRKVLGKQAIADLRAGKPSTPLTFAVVVTNCNCNCVMFTGSTTKKPQLPR